MHDHFDHSNPTHTAKCDDCEYIAKVHAHDDDSAVMELSKNLSAHNLQEHGQNTNPEDIKEAVAQKIKSAN
jgi:predicted small metal-binding protein